MTDIPYCDETWDLTIGCRKRSPGCEYCWATRTVHRLAGRGLAGYQGQAHCAGRNWLDTQSVNVLWANLDKPLHWREPRFVFVNSKSDLFDERVPFEFIRKAFDVMRRASARHRFMILTKCPERMREFIEWYAIESYEAWPSKFGHVILMVSVEGPGHMDRIDTLMEIPAAMRGVSFEPLLGPLPRLAASTLSRLDWVVIGCEKMLGGVAGRWAGTEPDAWWDEAARMVKACRDAGVACWVKQGPSLDVRDTGHGPRVTHRLEEFPENCRVQEKPEGLQI